MPTIANLHSASRRCQANPGGAAQPKKATMSTSLPSLVVRAFTPTGVLRASINLGNPILANKDAATGEPVGVSVDLARNFAQRLGVPIELVV